MVFTKKGRIFALFTFTLPGVYPPPVAQRQGVKPKIMREKDTEKITVTVQPDFWLHAKAAWAAMKLGLRQKMTASMPIWFVLLLVGIACLFFQPRSWAPADMYVDPMPLPTIPALPEPPAHLVVVDDGTEPVNDQHPDVLEAGLTQTNVTQYIQRFSRIAVIEMQKYGVPASISLAQGILESKAGESYLAKNANNHFGMKCFSKRCKRGHCVNRQDDSHKDYFVCYNSAWASWRAHSVLLSGSRYAKMRKHGRDYAAWADGLQRAGYATGRGYSAKLKRLIRVYKLDRFDQVRYAETR